VSLRHTRHRQTSQQRDTYICWYLNRSAGDTDGLTLRAASSRWRCVTTMPTGWCLPAAVCLATKCDFGDIELADVCKSQCNSIKTSHQHASSLTLLLSRSLHIAVACTMKTSTAHVLLSNLAYKGTARRYVITVIPGSSGKAISLPCVCVAS